MELSRKKILLQFSWRVVREIFQISLLTYLFFYLLESFIPGFISAQINLNMLLYIVIASGVIMVMVKSEQSIFDEVSIEKAKDNGKVNYFFIILLGLIAGILIYLKIRTLGWLALVISIISGLLVMLLSFLIYFNSQDNEKKGD